MWRLSISLSTGWKKRIFSNALIIRDIPWSDKSGMWTDQSGLLSVGNGREVGEAAVNITMEITERDKSFFCSWPFCDCPWLWIFL